MKLLEGAGSNKIFFKLSEKLLIFLQNFISFKVPSFPENYLQKGHFLRSGSTLSKIIASWAQYITISAVNASSSAAVMIFPKVFDQS